MQSEFVFTNSIIPLPNIQVAVMSAEYLKRIDLVHTSCVIIPKPFLFKWKTFRKKKYLNYQGYNHTPPGIVSDRVGRKKF